MVPFAEAAATAAACGMLRLEYGMSSHGSLLAVVRNDGRSQTVGNKVGRVLPYGIHAFGPDIGQILFRQVETASEPRFRQPAEQCSVVVRHVWRYRLVSLGRCRG